jgi:cellulase/cellobiase CelA1
MLDLGATTWWEGFNGYRDYGGSLSHGWGSSPTWFLTNYLAGVQRTGVDTWRIQPALAGTEHVNSRLPLQNGELIVEWQTGVCKSVQITITAPAGSKGEVIVPVTSTTMFLALNGRSIVRGENSGGEGIAWLEQGVRLRLGAGTHVLQVSPSCTAR